MHWLTRTGHIYERPVIPIDLRRDDWVVAYNVLRERERVAASVVTDNLVDALTYVWGASGTDQTPLLARIATTVFQALYEHKLTLAEALKLLEFPNHAFRATLAQGIKDEASRGTLEELNGLKALEYQIQVGSTRNRFQRLLRNISLRAAFGQTEMSFDFGQALREGSIVLVSLTTEGGTVSQENASTVERNGKERSEGGSRGYWLRAGRILGRFRRRRHYSPPNAVVAQHCGVSSLYRYLQPRTE